MDFQDRVLSIAIGGTIAGIILYLILTHIPQEIQRIQKLEEEEYVKRAPPTGAFSFTSRY